MSPRSRYATLLILTLPLGLVIRFVHFPWPYAISKYGGSALWAMAIYWLVSMVLPARSTAFRAGDALLLCFAIEFLKLVRTPALDAFRLTLPGRLLLGRYFSISDLIAYAIAITIAAVLDGLIVQRSRTSAVR